MIFYIYIIYKEIDDAQNLAIEDEPLPALDDLMMATFGEDNDSSDVVDDDGNSSSEANTCDESDLDATITEAIHKGYLNAKGVSSPKGKTK